MYYRSIESLVPWTQQGLYNLEFLVQDGKQKQNKIAPSKMIHRGGTHL